MEVAVWGWVADGAERGGGEVVVVVVVGGVFLVVDLEGVGEGMVVGNGHSPEGGLVSAAGTVQD